MQWNRAAGSSALMKTPKSGMVDRLLREGVWVCGRNKLFVCLLTESCIYLGLISHPPLDISFFVKSLLIGKLAINILEL